VPDHLVAWSGQAPRFEAWQVLGALATLTDRIRIGPLVSPVTFRHPGVVAKMAATLDHISGGRVILGLGAGGMADEHRRYGLPFGRASERARRLEESLQVIRSLLDDRSTTFRGRHFALKSAVAEPKPVQRRLPLLIAGSGRATIRLAARHAEMWNAICLPDTFGRHAKAMRSEASACGRPNTVLATASFRLIIRDEIAAIRSRIGELDAAWRDDAYRIQGGPGDVVEALSRYVRAGARGLIVQMPAPFDFVTLEHLSAIRPALVRAMTDQATGGTP
jgi:alkanesulfonate monooxygenase SsuD/methylene tetrahydromethanopterin reductase-like flavin-dependent oxidoreductase (luciferase family)